MNLQRKHRQNLLFVLIVLVAGVMGIGVYQLFINDLTQAAATDIERSQKAAATTVAREVERYFYDVQKRMEIIALTPAVRDAVRSEACNQNLQDLLEVNSKELNNLGRINKNGMFECAVNRTIIGEPSSKYGTYFETIAKDPYHQPVMTKLIFPTGAASGVIAVHVPVYNSKSQFNGTIGGAVYFNELQSRILTGVGVTKNSLVSLYDTNFDVIYDADPLVSGKNLLSADVSRYYSPQNATTSISEKIKHPDSEETLVYNFRGSPYQVIYKKVPVIGRNWTVAVAVPQQDIADAVNRQAATGLFIGVLSLLVLMVMGISYQLIYRSASLRLRVFKN